MPPNIHLSISSMYLVVLHFFLLLSSVVNTDLVVLEMITNHLLLDMGMKIFVQFDMAGRIQIKIGLGCKSSFLENVS